MVLYMTDLLALIGRDAQLRRTCARNGGEYSGPCPLCRRGTDRFKVWPQVGRWACLGPKAGRSGCDRGGDAIQYLIERDRVTYAAACAALGIEAAHQGAALYTKGRGDQMRASEPGSALSPRPYSSEISPPPEAVRPPNAHWQARAVLWAERSAAHLWQPEGARALAYLRRRGLGDAVLAAAGVGYNAQDVYEDGSLWGWPAGEGGARRVWLPRGITFPWRSDGALWRLNVRRPLTPRQIAGGEAKYIGPAGFANALYNADSLAGRGSPAVLVEGEIDALTIVQAMGTAVAVVATGSTGGARRAGWVQRLAAAPLVLVAFDADAPDAQGMPGAGDAAAAWWLTALPQARRWRPRLHDVNSLPDPAEVRAWLQRGLTARG